MVDIAKSTNYRKKGKAMTKEYRQLALKERKEIEEGLARGKRFVRLPAQSAGTPQPFPESDMC